MNNILKLLEALIFSSEQPISIADLQAVLFTFSGEEVGMEAIQEHVDALQLKYGSDDFVFEIIRTGGGYQFLSKPQYHKPISILLQHRSKRKLSVAALECLSIIAYSQPVTKIELEQIRGVNCDHTVQKLMERDLIKITGRSDTPGRPLLYGTTQYFMDYFGINNLEELPKLKEFEKNELAIGMPSDITENEQDENNYHQIKLNNERREDAQTTNENEEIIQPQPGSTQNNTQEISDSDSSPTPESK